ncbi:MAG: UPF0149 family protein [Pseudomonadota bacterium]
MAILTAGDLSQTELNELGQFLAEQEHAASLEYADGLLHAVAMAPRLIPPSKWFPLLFDPEQHKWESMAQAEKYTGLLMRLYNVAVSWVGPASQSEDPLEQVDEFDPLLDEADSYVERGADHVGAEWTAGFCAGVGLWEDAGFQLVAHPELDPLLNIIVRLAVWEEDEPLADNGEAIPALVGEERAKYLRLLKPAVLMLAQQMTSYAPKRKPSRSEKNGRNEPCPCGSGKKYKQCCLRKP